MQPLMAAMPIVAPAALILVGIVLQGRAVEKAQSFPSSSGYTSEYIAHVTLHGSISPASWRWMVRTAGGWA